MLVHPQFDPIALDLNRFGVPIAVHWYGITYLVGFGLFLFLAWRRARLPHFAVRGWTRRDIEDLLFYGVLGTVVGGRLGYVLFYKPAFYFSHPLEIFAVWKGGMAFHGGLAGASLGAWLFARKNHVPLWSVGDLCCAVAPIGLFLVRVANFIKPELWGRPTDVFWAMIFPGAGPEPRHPSQLYEAGLEGLALGLILAVAVRRGAFRRPGLTTGLFVALYGVARIFCEFFREPDPQLGFLFGGATMGMLLSAPLVLIGGVLIVYSLRRKMPAQKNLAGGGA
jgi:phosphatidylglycerol:prolipoprotein diacylglycerol transferase